MKNFKQIPLPDNMRNLPVDPRGLPVPYVVLQDEKGVYHFKINDTLKSNHCAVEGLCSICGKSIAVKQRWLVGGIASAFDSKGVYIDLAVHKECAVYALQVCFYMAIKNYSANMDLEKLQAKHPTLALNNPTVDPDKLPLFVLVRFPKITYKLYADHNIRVEPTRPALEVEFWDAGVKLTTKEEVTSRVINTKWEKYLPDMLPFLLT
jgi:hypothetical protein